MEGDAVLTAEIEDGLYRISQDALNNALKHAQARSIRLLLLKGEQLVALEVADDGVGFDLATAEEHGGLGLCGMRERAARLGGTLTVESRPGEGTTVRVEVSR